MQTSTARGMPGRRRSRPRRKASDTVQHRQGQQSYTTCTWLLKELERWWNKKSSVVSMMVLTQVKWISYWPINNVYAFETWFPFIQYDKTTQSKLTYEVKNSNWETISSLYGQHIVKKTLNVNLYWPPVWKLSSKELSVHYDRNGIHHYTTRNLICSACLIRK